MASTTLMPLDPALSPQQVTRVLSISADLLPEEIVAARRAHRTRAWVLAMVGVVVLALAGWYMIADRTARDANTDLEAVTVQQTRLQRTQADYAEVVNTQSDSAAIANQLKTLMANDMQWADLIETLRDTGTANDATVEGIAAALNAADGSGSGSTSLPSASGAASVGTVTVTGTAQDKPSVARYVEALDDISAIANPYVTSVSQNEDGTVKFALTVDITARALCGRFTTKCTTSGGK